MMARPDTSVGGVASVLVGQETVVLRNGSLANVEEKTLHKSLGWRKTNVCSGTFKNGAIPGLLSHALFS